MMTLVSVETFQNKDVGSSFGDFIYLQIYKDLTLLRPLDVLVHPRARSRLGTFV